MLAASGLGWAAAQSPVRQDDPPAEPVPVVVELPEASVVIEAAVEAEEPEETATEVAPGPVPAGEQAAAAAVVPGSTNGVPDASGAPRSSRRSRERSPARDWRTSFGARNKDGSTNAPGPAKTDYAYFQVVNSRNIFNPSRVPNRPDRPASGEAKKVTKVEAFSLVGTLRYEKGDLAFFDGSSSEYRKGFKAGESLAGYKVVSVSDAAVRIEAKGAVTELKIGSQMRREDEGEWKLASGPYAGGSSGSSSSSGETAAVSEGPGSAAPASAGAGGGSADEILKRLLQKREQEMKNEK